jgi:hypothetical protein
VIGFHCRTFSTHNPRHQYVEAAREFADAAKANGAPRFGALDGGRRGCDISVVVQPDVAGSLLCVVLEGAAEQMRGQIALRRDEARVLPADPGLIEFKAITRTSRRA